MHLHELKSSITKKVVSNLYIFTGEELGIMDLFIEKVSGVGNLPVKRVDSLSSIYSRLTNNTISNQASCYVIRDDKEFLKEEKVWEKELQTGDNIIILVFSNMDKRSKFYKFHKETIVEFEKLSPDILAKYIMKEVILTPTQAIEMAELCGCSYTRIMLECDKLIHLAKGTKTEHPVAYNMMKEEGLLFTEADDVVFSLIDMVCLRQIPQSYELLEEFKEFAPSPLGALVLLYNNFKNLLIVQSYKGDSITKSTGLTGWQVGMAKKKMGRYSLTELVHVMATIKETEKGIKTGWIEADQALNYILAAIM